MIKILCIIHKIFRKVVLLEEKLLLLW